MDNTGNNIISSKAMKVMNELIKNLSKIIQYGINILSDTIFSKNICNAYLF